MLLLNISILQDHHLGINIYTSFYSEINTVYVSCCERNCPNACYLMMFLQDRNICTWVIFIL